MGAVVEVVACIPLLVPRLGLTGVVRTLTAQRMGVAEIGRGEDRMDWAAAARAWRGSPAAWMVGPPQPKQLTRSRYGTVAGRYLGRRALETGRGGQS